MEDEDPWLKAKFGEDAAEDVVIAPEFVGLIAPRRNFQCGPQEGRRALLHDDQLEVLLEPQGRPGRPQIENRINRAQDGAGSGCRQGGFGKGRPIAGADRQNFVVEGLCKW